MRRKISSSLTALHRLLWVGFLIVILFVAFSTLDIGEKLLYSFVLAVSLLAVLMTSLELTDVELDENYIYVTHGKSSIQVPLSMIRNVRESILWSIQRPLIIVDFKIATRFGLSIKFVPYYYFGQLIFQHPLVNHLKRLANIDENS